MLAPILAAAAVLLVSADAATLPIARTIGNTCAALDVGLVLSSHLLWPFPTNFGRFKGCGCIDTLDQYLQVNSVTRTAVDVVGLATVRSYIAAAIYTSSRRPGSCYVPQGLSCVPCSLKIGEGDSLVVAANSKLNTGLNLGKGDALKANASLDSTSDVRVGTTTGTTTLDTSLDTNTSLSLDSKTNTDLTDLDTDLKLNTSLDANTSLNLDSKTNADLKAAVDIGANVKAKTDVQSDSSVVVGSKADLDLSAKAKLGLKVHLASK